MLLVNENWSQLTQFVDVVIIELLGSLFSSTKSLLETAWLPVFVTLHSA